MNDGFVNGEKIRIIPIERLLTLKNEVDHFKKGYELNSFQKWIVDDLYIFELPHVDFPIKSIILMAIPHPFYAEIVFTMNKKKYNCLSPVMSDFEKAEKTLKRLLATHRYLICKTQNLPLKRLAVQSGFAVYGRNNICYIDGMGSNFSFAAYYSDMPCDDEYWTDVAMARRCTKCKACFAHCPTGAIRKNGFLIDNERCLSYWNESAEPFPEWMPKSAHHCLYDCIKCQVICPMNKDQIKHTVGPVRFNESETNMLLSGFIYERQSVSFKKKVKYLGLHQWPDGISKNIKTLIALNNIL
ncbi:MAG: 4Fe-4S binding protein [Spirochaetales bacterium]|nr:4Fe-4S binding protein [Spirochaetales bacterium]